MEVPPKKLEQSRKADLVRDPEQAEERRKALKAIGKLGFYTAPALLALLKSGRAARVSGG